MPQFTHKASTISYQEQGAGLPVVLLHGFPLDRRVWDAQVAELSKKYRVITLDLPGFGQSKASVVFTMESLAMDVQALLRHLKAVPCALAGLSMGGYVALAYEQLCPTDIKGLILVDTKADADTTEGKLGREKMIELCKAAGSKAISDQMMPKMVSEETVQRKPHVIHQLRQIMEACPPQTIQWACAAMKERPDRTELLASIADPTLIILGEKDAIIPVSTAQAMQKAIPRCTLAVIAGAGHMAPMEDPAAVNAALDSFLQQLT